MNQQLIESFVNMDEKKVLEITSKLLNSDTDPFDVLGACRLALEKIGKQFETGQSFLPELIMGGEIMKQVSTLVKPKISKMSKQQEDVKKGKVLIGSVAGDIHDIGKNIVTFMLDVNGYDVFDMGVDVPPEAFVEKIKEINPHVVGLSCLLTTAFESMKATVDAISEAGLRDRVKIAIGGGTVDNLLVEYTGADAYGADAMAAVDLARQWTKEVSYE